MGLEQKRTVLILTNDVKADTMLWLELLDDGHDVHLAATGSAALEWLRANTPDLAILHGSTLVVSGFDICRAIRRSPAGAQTRIILLVDGQGLQERIEARYAGSDVCLAADATSVDRLINTAEMFLSEMPPPCTDRQREFESHETSHA